MKDLNEWADMDGSIASEIEQLFNSAGPTRGMTKGERLRSVEAVRAIAATPAPKWSAIITKHFITVVLTVSTVGALVGGGSGIETKVLEDERAPMQFDPPPIKIVPEPAVLAPIVATMDVASIATMPRTEHPALKSIAPLPQESKSHLSKSHLLGLDDGSDGAPAEERTPQVANGGVINDAPSNGQVEDKDTLARELALIEKAQSALTIDPSKTLDLLDEYKKKFPAGRHTLRREILAIDALLNLGRKVEARARAEVLLPRVAGTPFEARVQKQLTDAR